MYWRIMTGTPYTPPPPAEQEDVYLVVYKGEEIARYEYNPEDKIKELSDQLEDCQKLLAAKTIELSQAQANLQKQEADNARLATSLRDCHSKRDQLVVDNKSIAGQLESCQNRLKDVSEKLDAIKNKNQLEAYSGWELIKLGFNKLLGKNNKEEKEGGEDNG